MYPADTLSRAYLPPDKEDEKLAEDLEVMVHAFHEGCPI